MPSPAEMLVADPDQPRRMHPRAALGHCYLLEAYPGDETPGFLRGHAPPVVLVDLGPPSRPGGVDEGFALLEAIMEASPGSRVVVVTGQDDHEHAARAVDRGTRDSRLKPIRGGAVRVPVDRAAVATKHEEKRRQRLAATGNGAPLPGIIGSSPAMRRVCRAVERVAPADVSVVLTGESGTGKEVVARALHAASSRKGERFVAINCAAIPEALLESELFGHERGAFTGAVKQTLGKIELAHRGTLFLDEIGDLPLSLQGKLLRFLQERVIERVGGRKEIKVDARVICATHRDLRKLLEQGGFREDLYYRLAEISIDIPPLRERDGDAVLMACHFLAQYSNSLKRRIDGYTEAALQALDAYPWPGNVRELQNRVKRAVIMAEGPRVTPEDLDLATAGDPVGELDLRGCRERAERAVLLRALARSAGNLSLAARLIGVSRPTLYDLLRQHGFRTDGGEAAAAPASGAHAPG